MWKSNGIVEKGRSPEEKPQKRGGESPLWFTGIQKCVYITTTWMLSNQHDILKVLALYSGWMLKTNGTKIFI